MSFSFLKKSAKIFVPIMGILYIIISIIFPIVQSVSGGYNNVRKGDEDYKEFKNLITIIITITIIINNY